MGIVAELLNYVHYAFAALVLYVVWRYVSGLNVSGGGLRALLSRFQGPDHAAREARKKGDHLVAGRLYEDLEMFDEAVETYLEGNEQWAAASVLEKQRRFDRAAQLYHDAGDLKKAAEVYEAAGKPARAAAVYVEDGNNLEAARAHGEAGEWEQAAELYIKAGFPLRAAGAYEQLGEPLRAAECYESHFMENVAYATSGYGSTAPSRELATARKAGELFEQAEKPLRAREMYSRGGFYPEAARVSWELGEYERAAELYQRAEDLSAAAEAWIQAGDPVKAALLKGEVAFKENRLEEAAALFQEGKDYLRAAELFETLELWDRAARAYEDAASFGSAAGVYLRAGMKREAAAAFEKGGSWEDAARLYQEAGDGAKAASLYERAGLAWRSGLAAADSGDRQEAIRLLQQVPPGDENYIEATERLGELFVEAGMHSVAIERLGKALSGQPIARANLPLYYWLARAHEARPDPASAAAIYKKVVAEDVGYRDARERLSRLGTQVGAPAPAPTGPGSVRPPAPTLQPAVAGQRIGRYQIQRLLGQGAMGRVYVARDTMLERDVALKLMATPDDSEQRQRFEREARAIARMTHPNVVTVFDMGHSDDGSVYIAMELLRGQDLLHALRQSPALRSLERRLAVILQVLAGLDHAHRAGIVHRDVKPANVFIGHDGSVRLMDFGVARLSTASLTGAGRVVGTADYMSPEQVQGGAVEGPSDLFSVGVMLFELITGQRPFRAGSLMATFYAVTHREPDWNALPAGAVNAGLEPIVRRALAKDAAERYASASEMASDLREVIRRRSEASGRSVEQLLDLSGTLGGQGPIPDADDEAAGVGGPAAEAPPTRPSAQAPGVTPPPLPSRRGTMPPGPGKPPRPPTVPPAAGAAPPRRGTMPPAPEKPPRPPTVPPAAGAAPPRRGTMPPAPEKPPRPPTVPPAAGAVPPRRGTMPPAPGKPPRPPTVPPAAGAAPPRRGTMPPGPGKPPRPPTVPPAAGGAPPRGTARFQKQAEIGRGPLGTVFRAVDATSGRSLALRVLPPRSEAAQEAWASLLDDLRTAGRVTHPGLVRVLGMVEAEGRAQVLSELIEGYDLETALAAGAMAEARVEALGRALAAAVAHVHERGLAHGSIRPSNVMLAGGAVRLADLGLGRLYEAIGPDTPYRAPERGLSPQADVYSLGAVLYHALTGAAPAGEGPEAPGSLGDLVRSCLDPDPAARPTAADLQGRLGQRSS